LAFIPCSYGWVVHPRVAGSFEDLDDSSSDVVFKEVLVSRHRADGTVERNVVKISDDQFDDFVYELGRKDTLSEKFEVYRRYGLVSEDVSFDELGADIQVNEGFSGLVQYLVKRLTRLRPHGGMFSSETVVDMNSQCEVFGIINDGMKYFIGLSAITSFINFLLWHRFQHFPSADLLDVYAADWGRLDAVNGTMPDFHTTYGFIFILLVGFVGYTFAYPPIPGKILIGEFYGTAMFVLCQH
jgi:hypothetical protein